MRTGYLVGFGAGVASALLSYSATRGSSALLVILLGLLTPLPSLLVGLGWGWLPAATAAAVGALATGVATDALSAAGYLLTLGVPSVLIAYLAYLNRPNPDGSDAREWYPPGRLMAAMALYAGALPVLFLPLIGGSYEALRNPVGKEFQRLSLRLPELGMKPMTEQQVEAFTDLFITTLPAVLAAYWLIVFTVNAYLAGRIVLASGRLVRDWPDLPAMAYPAGFPLLLMLAVAASYAPGIVGVAGTSFAGALLLAYLVAGLSLTHFIARGRAPWALWFVYAGLILFGPYAAVIITLGGLIDPLFKLKQRLGAHPPSN
jgi:Predicted membrane protein (DUF2232)